MLLYPYLCFPTDHIMQLVVMQSESFLAFIDSIQVLNADTMGITEVFHVTDILYIFYTL